MWLLMAAPVRDTVGVPPPRSPLGCCQQDCFALQIHFLPSAAGPSAPSRGSVSPVYSNFLPATFIFWESVI